MNPATNTKSKSKQLLIAAGCLLVLIVVIVAIANHSSNKKAAPRVATATISSAGFQPGELLVKTNTKVTWTNTDSKGHTVSANPYPTHSSLISLASSALIQGQSYSYTFTKAGTYHYHDDLNPTLNATIVVEK